MKISEVLKILDKETAWHISHKGQSKESQDWERGFLAGLKQAKITLKAANEVFGA